MNLVDKRLSRRNLFKFSSFKETVPAKNYQNLNFFLLLMKYQLVADVVVEL